MFAQVFSASGQADTLVRVQLPSGKTTAISVNINAANSRVTTSHHLPTAMNPLPTDMPTLNLMEGAQFTIPTASGPFAIDSYPASTNVQLATYKKDQAVAQCSGVMISPNLVLTAGHCIVDVETRAIAGDEIAVSASGKNLVNGGALVTKATAVYLLKNYLDKDSKDDIMLVELADQIGDHTGWMGMSFLADSSYAGTVFHKFSYPSRSYDPQSTPGRKLHYNYGAVNVIGPDLLGVNSGSATATPGQSGSPFFYIDKENPYVVGVSIFARVYQHQRITQNILNVFRPIVEGSISHANALPFLMYPNPVRQSAIVKVGEKLKHYTFAITNLSGEVLKTQVGNDSDFFFIERGHLAAGEYRFILVDDRKRTIRGGFRIVD
jgi:V8-like Glu-specific endopeptidase